jgi:hypothetical protein
MPSEIGRDAEIKGYGVSIRIPLPRWAITSIAIVIVVGLIAVGAFASATTMLNRAFVPKDTLNEYTHAAYHANEAPDAHWQLDLSFKDATKVTVLHYLSDKCDYIVRLEPGSQHGEGKWVYGPNVKPEQPNRTARSFFDLPRLEPSMSVQQAGLFSNLYLQPVDDLAAGAQPGRCVEGVHPGRFREQGESLAQCVTKVWRYFEDGCIHYQMFNPCAGTWDVYPNGAPHVVWTHCVH